MAEALIAQPRSPLPLSEKFIGAGVYAIYYRGDFVPYRPLAARNRSKDGKNDWPIYVGKTVSAGARKGGFELDISPGSVLYNRLCELDDIWIPLGESLLIEMFNPIWNRLLDGFGNHDPGRGRHQGRMPAWDVLHPGRVWAGKLQPGKSLEAILAEIAAFFQPSK